jgi:HlyD family secretion protein
VDTGSRVKKGDLLVRIASPDLDAQLAQDKAALLQTEASLSQAVAQEQQLRSSAELALLPWCADFNPLMFE